MSEFELVQGDVRDPTGVRSALAGADTVVHLASSFSPDDRVADIVIRGTECVLAAAMEIGVRRLVYLSCLGADAASEAPFYRAMWRAETLIRAGDVPFTVLRSSLIVGPGTLRPLAAVVRDLPAVPVPGSGRHRMQPIDAKDVARCISRAVANENMAGETAPIGGPMFVTLRQLFDLIASELGVFKPKVLVPYRLLPLIDRFLPLESRPLFRQPRLAQFQHGVVASPGVVERAFEFRPLSILPGMAGYMA